MSTKTANDLVDRRYDFVYFFDVTDGNPNGDPDAGNMPRVDPQTLQGIVTDVCIKRKIRNAVAALCGEEPGYDLYFQTQDAVYEKRILNRLHALAHEAVGDKKELKEPKAKADQTAKARAWMCDHFFDVRTFGAVMTTGDKSCGQVRGPVQITFARSIDPIFAMDVSITRKSVTTEKDAEKQAADDGAITGTMGRKSAIPYALYRGSGFINPLLAADTRFTKADLKRFFQAMISMFDLDRSASRGLMAMRKIVLFEHENKLGNAPSHLLFDRISIQKLGVDKAPREYADYAMSLKVDRDNLPNGVRILELPEDIDAI